jgi:hypothetical protein
MVFEIKDFRVISKNEATYIPSWKKFVCLILNITPEKRYHYTIEPVCYLTPLTGQLYTTIQQTDEN